MSIEIKDGYIYLGTENTCYVIAAHGDAEHIYYGARIPLCDVDALRKRQFVPLVNALYYSDDNKYSFDAHMSEYTFAFCGDSDGASLCLPNRFDFVVERIEEGIRPPSGDMPIPGGWSDSLCLTLNDTLARARVELWYLVFEKRDIIMRFACFVNTGTAKTVLTKFDSFQLDLPGGEYDMTLLKGAWGRECSPYKFAVNEGGVKAGSHCGMSSAECNPFFLVEGEGAAYAFNLIYSGAHETGAKKNCLGRVRISSGMQSEGLLLNVLPGERIVAPCAVMTCSKSRAGVSRNMQLFISEHILRQNRIPVALNTWEAMYFALGEEKLRLLADEAHDLGFECIVIDDGWFEERRDDRRALGDWVEDRTIFPSGIGAFENYLKGMGMSLGIWIEPEMVSKDSKLYRAHPDWALRCDGLRDIEGRNQYILDMTCKEVQKYVFDSLEYLVDDLGAKYIKWDFNRRFADVAGEEGSGYFYRYYSGLYRVLAQFCEKHPEVVIENCASGGGRYDLGMMYFTSACWPSDNTDPLSRTEIMSGILRGYPPCNMLTHLAVSPSHQTHRSSSFKSRLDAASFGAFGVQADITAMNNEEKTALKAAVAKAKNRRKRTVAYVLDCPQNFVALQSMTEDGEEGEVLILQKRQFTSAELPWFKLEGLEAKARYRYDGAANGSASGNTLMCAGITLPQAYHGDKVVEGMTVLGDFGTAAISILKEKQYDI